MIEYLLLFFAIPLGFVLAGVTKDEKEIYAKTPYFPVLLWILASVSAICYIFNKQIAVTLTFILITTFIWNKY
ncbi:hypothetical protein KAJ38_03170 [Candidatus Pacearchaeota archaeon]|nr:hypothetical protein [Candidatus Pacearchaeota archaeon]